MIPMTLRTAIASEMGPAMTARQTRILIMGAAGRDFHDFNMLYRDDPTVEVVAFTAAQIPGIADRRYPPALAGYLYPDGIPIEDEAEMHHLCTAERIDRVRLRLQRRQARGRDAQGVGGDRGRRRFRASGGGAFHDRGARTRRRRLRRPHRVRQVPGRPQYLGPSAVARPARRGPAPPDALWRAGASGGAAAGDAGGSARADCTVERTRGVRTPHPGGNIVFAGVDYQRITRAAASEAEVIIWDGGNNDIPFLRPGPEFTLVDPFRPGDETGYHPGEAALRMADAVVVAKSNSAPDAGIEQTMAGTREVNPGRKSFAADRRSRWTTRKPSGAVACWSSTTGQP